MQSPPATPFQDTDELAATFKVKPRTIRAWHRQGKLRGIRLGRRLLFRREDVDTLVNGQLPDPQEAA